MMDAENQIQPFERMPTGIEGLDVITHGGFLKGGVYLLMGPPGSGKTILSNQIAFYNVARGGHGVYVALLAESQARMLGNLKPLSFFRESDIATHLHYFGAYGTLVNEGLDGLLKALREMVRKNKATMLFIDGIASAEQLSNSVGAFKKFIHDLNAVISAYGCTTFLLSSQDGATQPEHTMVDGIVSLSLCSHGMRTYRQMEVVKFRGSPHLMGKHFFRISGRGIEVFPRTESYLGQQDVKDDRATNRHKLGIAGLDKMIDGGLPEGTITSLIGAGGTAKSILSIKFLLEGVRQKEKGVMFSFYESPQRLIGKMASIGIDLDGAVKQGTVQLAWQAPLEHSIDELFQSLFKRVRASGAKRLVFDGIGGLRHSAMEPSRLPRALSALTNELRLARVTTIFTEETELFATNESAPISDLSAVIDNALWVRKLMIGSELRRFVSVIKMRESDYDREAYELLLQKGKVGLGKTLSQLRKGKGASRPGASRE